MKKLTLTSPAFQKGEVLTRAQLKKVMGGVGSGGSDDACSSQCLAIGSHCGTAENPGTCGWVSDANCPGGGFGMCFIPFG
ncbi:hypothetical protein [Pedobacter borealis]|uniref:hypothetical protein n=1 Tax=Pedobacter borealis TaxID=475254 RepID=UPI0004938B45|nr:hypothetical protein [Pedobacter borealis]